jgi:D-Tyr-tRNAtyr deacylase
MLEKFLARLMQDFGKPIQTGEFGADMQGSLANDGPVPHRFQIARVMPAEIDCLQNLVVHSQSHKYI